MVNVQMDIVVVSMDIVGNQKLTVKKDATVSIQGQAVDVNMIADVVLAYMLHV